MKEFLIISIIHLFIFPHLRLSIIALCCGERSDAEVDLKVFLLLNAGTLHTHTNIRDSSKKQEETLQTLYFLTSGF